jgi:hypothetical protein
LAFGFPLQLSRKDIRLESRRKKHDRRCKADLARVDTISVIVAFFAQRSSMKFRRFPPENYVQTHLAWGLCLRAIGEREKGEMHLQEYCNRFSIVRDDRILRQAEQDARMAFVT